MDITKKIKIFGVFMLGFFRGIIILVLITLKIPAHAQALNETALEDIATALALYNDNNPQFIEQHSKTIFTFLGQCDAPATVENIEQAKKSYERLARRMWMIPFQPILGWRISKAAQNTNYRFYELNNIRKNVFKLFEILRADVEAGDFKSCKEKTDFTLSKISPERLEYLQSLAKQ